MTNDIFDKEYLIRIWENERKTRDLNSTLMWENIKYFGALFSGLLVAQVALYPFVFDIHNPGIFPVDKREIIFVIPVAIIILSFLASKDLKERRKRFHLVVSHLLKLEELLGLHDDIAYKLKSFKNDKVLFPKYKDNLIPPPFDTDTFIEDQMKEKSTNAYTSLGKIYGVMIGIATSLILMGIIFLNPTYFSKLFGQ